MITARTVPAGSPANSPEVPIPRLCLEKLAQRLQSHNPQEVEAPDARSAAVSLILSPIPGDFEILFMKRAERKDDPWSGHISLPGGHRDPEDADLVETAVREAREEVGIVIDGPPVVQLDDVHPMTPMLPPVVVRPFVFVVEPFQHLTLGSEAALEIRIGLNDLVATRTRRTVRERNLLLSVRGFSVGPHFVWGLTERVLTPFLARLGFP